MNQTLKFWPVLIYFFSTKSSPGHTCQAQHRWGIGKSSRLTRMEARRQRREYHWLHSATEQIILRIGMFSPLTTFNVFHRLPNPQWVVPPAPLPASLLAASPAAETRGMHRSCCDTASSSWFSPPGSSPAEDWFSHPANCERWTHIRAAPPCLPPPRVPFGQKRRCPRNKWDVCSLEHLRGLTREEHHQRRRRWKERDRGSAALFYGLTLVSNAPWT